MEITGIEREMPPRELRLDVLIALIRIAKQFHFTEAGTGSYITPLSHSMESWREEVEGIIDTPAGLAYCIVSPQVEYDAEQQSHIAQIVFENHGKPCKYDFFVRQEAPNDAISSERHPMSYLLGELYYDDLEDDRIYRPTLQTVEIYRDLPPLHLIEPDEPEIDRTVFSVSARRARCIGNDEAKMLAELLEGVYSLS